MTSVSKDRILIRHQPHNKITKIQILGCKYFLLYSLNCLNILIYLYSFICILLFIFIILIISYCIIIHLSICVFVILLIGWCRMAMRPARLVSYAFLYTTYVSPHVRFTSRTFHPTYVSPHVRFTPRKFNPTYVSPYVRFTPHTFHPKDMSLRIKQLVWPNNILYKPVAIIIIIMPIN